MRRVIILRWVVQEYGAYEPVVHFFGFSSMLYNIQFENRINSNLFP